jgi:phage terminase Nu1 subunit (DNA packaging protein)
MEDLPQYVDSQQAVANALGVDRHTVKDWIAEGAPKKTSAGYDVRAIAAWRELYKKTTTQHIDVEEYQIRMLTAKLLRAEGEAMRAQSEGKLKQHEVRQTTTDIVHLDDVEMLLNIIFGEIRRILARIPKEIRNGYPEEFRNTLEEDLDARLSIALRSISGQCRRITDLRK